MPLGIIFSLLLAVLLNQKVPVMGVFRTLFYLPSILPAASRWRCCSVAAEPAVRHPQLPHPLVGRAERHDSAGHHRAALASGSELGDTLLYMLSLWGFGGGMLIYLSALQGVPTHLYEAATIDGARPLPAVLQCHACPMISPVILFTFITGVIGSFQVFTQAYGSSMAAPAHRPTRRCSTCCICSSTPSGAIVWVCRRAGMDSVHRHSALTLLILWASGASSTTRRKKAARF